MEYTLTGFDVSKHQGKVDWKKAAKGMDFVLIRAGYGRFPDQKDPRFEENIRGAAEAGVAVGVYWYSYAPDRAEAEEEAKVCLKILEPFRERIRLPVFFDQEYEPRILSAGKKSRTEAAAGFCEKIAQAGYRAGFYGSLDWLKNKLDVGALPAGTVIWCARYGDQTPDVSHTVWQHTSEGKVNGIAGAVDLNRAGKALLGETWEKTEKGWRYGGARNEWKKLGGRWYWFDQEGIAVAGWRKVGGRWYYFLTREDAGKTGYPECACMSLSE